MVVGSVRIALIIAYLAIAQHNVSIVNTDLGWAQVGCIVSYAIKTKLIANNVRKFLSVPNALVLMLLKLMIQHRFVSIF